MWCAVVSCTALFFPLPGALNASDAVPRLAPGVTLIFKFPETVSPALQRALDEEVSRLIGRTGITVNSKLLSEVASGEQFASLVVVDFKGRCRLDAYPIDRVARTTLAFTHRSDGEILPFVDVLCDQIRATISPALSADHLLKRDKVFGRALGRVIAHELYHVLGRTRGHGSMGIAGGSVVP